jgi:hypothetical protein
LVPGHAIATLAMRRACTFLQGSSAAATVCAAADNLDLRLTELRAEARRVPGEFASNTVPIEAVTPNVWRAADGWSYKDAEGFALRLPNQTGDWHLFREGDGNGNYALQEENGGRLLSTTAFLFEAGVDPDMLDDWSSLVQRLEALLGELQAAGSGSGPPSPPPPLLPGQQLYLRTPMVSELVQALCTQVRPGANVTLDRWGTTVCSRYKSVTYDLPESGAFVFAFASGLLDLEVPVPVASGATPALRIHGTVVPVPCAMCAIPLPLKAATRWPPGLAQLTVAGLNVGRLRNVSLDCQVADPVTRLQCSIA